MADRLPQHLVIFAKAPVMGQVKTRLANDIGDVEATGFFRQNTISLRRRMSLEPHWQTWVAVTPDALAMRPDFVDVLGAPAKRIPQGRGNLGDRMQRMFDLLQPGPVVIIGCDIPDIEPFLIRRAFQLLGHRETVFGPANDGGYWLVGQRRRPRVLKVFEGVRWSSPHALADTLANLPKGTTPGFVAEMVDIDTGADYIRWQQEKRHP